MAYNLARNSRVFVTTNINTATGAVLTSGLTVNNTWEVQVLDGFKFSQGTNAQNIAINEAGDTPVRGERSFNTALNPVDISFSTYIRPRLNSGQATAEERVLWNALLGYVGIEGTVQAGATVSGTTLGGTPTGSVVRASSTAAVCTISGTSMSTLTVGNIYNVTGMTGTSANSANTPAKVITSTGTNLVIEYLTAPPSALTATLSNVTVSSSVKFTQSAWQEYPTATGITTSYGQVTAANSNRNQLQPIGFIFIVDGATYTIDNCAIDQAQIDFGLDAISTIAWSAKGTKLNQLTTPATLDTSTNPIFSGGITGTATGKVTTANYITNKLSTVTLQSNLGGIGGTSYSVVLTGGSIQINNNIGYVTPNNIGVLNIPIGYYTGARAITGTLNAYLKTGSNNPTSQLLADMLANVATATETKYRLQVEVGGSSNGTRVEIEMPGAQLGIPSVDVADVVSTSITFNGQSTNTVIAGNTYDIENTNDLTIRYFSL